MEQSKKDELKHRYETLFGHAIDKFFIDKTFDFFFKIIEGEEKQIQALSEEKRESGFEAIRAMTRLLPPEEFGESYDAELLQNIILELSGLTDEDLK